MLGADEVPTKILSGTVSGIASQLSAVTELLDW